ncbi:metallophosphoesterase [Clostridium acetobutylicum]|uniref:metallophosphoesterase n=1 Tax=Clostridium acetobutylicum TaxID=1488 RepID=UPI00180EE7B9|nr:metallophosphoesterase [Clostridium acetobutylicum]NYC94121.1 2',3'-cyclic-nucleotide 2'-phosphodiesterase (5'-nucleotidase family) [Clostridium acetobutylicum]
MGNELEHIVILETSDVHGNIFPVNYADNSEEQFGLVKLSTIVKNERKRNSKLILIDNGDTFQGTPITYYYAKIARGFSNPVIDILNYMKYDAAVIGNHEFNYGMEILNDSIKQSKFPWLSCNIIDTKTKETAFGVPYIIKEFRGDLRIAILGVTTKYIPNWENQDIIKDLKFLDVIEETKKWVRILKNDKKVDIVVVSYHGGFEKNIDTGEETESQTGENQAYELCNEVDGIDVLLTGHQHREIYGMKINGVTIIQPGSSAKNIGKVDIIAEKTLLGWRIVESKSSLISVSNISSDYKAGKIAEKYEIATQAWLDTPIGRIKGDMTIKKPN